MACNICSTSVLLFHYLHYPPISPALSSNIIIIIFIPSSVKIPRVKNKIVIIIIIIIIIIFIPSVSMIPRDFGKLILLL